LLSSGVAASVGSRSGFDFKVRKAIQILPDFRPAQGKEK
jgi:hypothetical protein